MEKAISCHEFGDHEDAVDVNEELCHLIVKASDRSESMSLWIPTDLFREMSSHEFYGRLNMPSS
jgi:hypothetical protein